MLPQTPPRSQVLCWGPCSRCSVGAPPFPKSPRAGKGHRDGHNAGRSSGAGGDGHYGWHAGASGHRGPPQAGGGVGSQGHHIQAAQLRPCRERGQGRGRGRWWQPWGLRATRARVQPWGLQPEMETTCPPPTPRVPTWGQRSAGERWPDFAVHKRWPRLVSPLMRGLVPKWRCWVAARGNDRAAALCLPRPGQLWAGRGQGQGQARPAPVAAWPSHAGAEAGGIAGTIPWGDSHPAGPNSCSSPGGGTAPLPAAGTRGCGSLALGPCPQHGASRDWGGPRAGGVLGQTEPPGRADETVSLHGPNFHL